LSAPKEINANHTECPDIDVPLATVTECDKSLIFVPPEVTEREPLFEAVPDFNPYIRLLELYKAILYRPSLPSRRTY